MQLQSSRNYKLRKKHIKHGFTTKQWIEKREYAKGICPMCYKNVGTENLTMDHIYPVSKAELGKVYNIDDVQPLCKSCNSRKNNKVID